MKKDNDKLALRVYDDAVSPAAKVVGQSLEAVVRTCLRPVDGVIWSTNQAMDWIAKRLTQVFKADGTRPDEIVKPCLEVEGRIIQHIQIVGPTADNVLCGQFVALLASGMRLGDSTSCHPALADVLRSLLPSEARLFAVLHSFRKCIVSIPEIRAHWLLTRISRMGISFPKRDGPANERDPIDPRIEIQVEPLWDKYNISFDPTLGTYDCLANMIRLGLVKTYEVDESEKLIMDPAGRSYSDELHQWRDKLQYLSENKPPWCVPKDNDWKAEVKEIIRAIVVEVTPRGELLGKSCRSDEFFNGKEIVIPAWASDRSNEGNIQD